MIHPIEAESYRIMEEWVDLSDLKPLARAVTARIIHATADIEFADNLFIDEAMAQTGVDAIRAGAPVVVDVEMVRAGITGVATECFLADAVAEGDTTRSAMAIRLAAERHPDGAIFVIGCAPTALFELVRLARQGRLRPAFVIGLPVGFVGADESKTALRASGLPAIANGGERGGSAAAAAAFNALLRVARQPETSR